jgi:beta-1,2-mannobiose phosphorylase / 1,2-beta-oligomannan phosphorylase
MKFIKSDANPIIKPNPDNAWESLVTCNPGAWYENGTFYLLYRGAGHDEAHLIHLGLATSQDGIHFERYENNPVMSPTPEGFDAGCVEDPRIVKFDDLFYVTYAYRPFPPGQYWLKKHHDHGWPMGHHTPKGLWENTTNTGLAISKDLKSFKKLGRITQHQIDNRDVILFPEKINGKFVMLHRPVQWTGEKYGTDVPSIWLAYSDDLMSWQGDHLLAKPEFDWESKKIGGSTPPLKTKDGWLVIYHGVSKDDEQYRVGAMLLDLNDPKKIIARSSKFLMEPEHPYETDGYYTGCVFPTGNVIVGDTLYMYYGGADRFVCVATISVSELLKELLNEKK